MGICEYMPYSYSVYQNLLNVNTFSCGERSLPLGPLSLLGVEHGQLPLSDQ